MTLNTVGKSMIRVDAYSKVTGKALYPQDIYMDNMLYGKTLRSELPHAYIEVDTSEAENIEGVIKIFTYKDVPHNEHGVVLKDHEVFCSNKVRRIGDPIAFVVGESEEACKNGMKKIKVNYRELEGVFDPVEAMKKEAPKVHDELDSNIISHYKLRTGDVDKAFENCAVVVENTYTTNMQEHAFLQPEAGLSYVDEDENIVVVVATQYPHYDREEIAKTLNIEEEKIKVLNTNIGGAFGAREDITIQIHLALAASILKRPVKTILDREESFLAHCKRHPMIMKYKTGADKDGCLQAMEVEIIGDSGAYCSWAINVLRKAGVHASGPYFIPNVKVDSYAVYTNNPFSGAMRGFGATQVPIGAEQQMDELAEKLGMNPIEIRQKNILKKGFRMATGQILIDGVPLDKCLEKIYDRYEEYKELKKEGKNRGVGIGLSFYGTGYGNGFPDVSRAEIKLLEDGRVGIFAGATEVGQGAKTALIQIGAETLNIDPKDVVLVCEDTSKMPDSGTAAATRQTYNTGNAIKIACENFNVKIIEAAQKELKLNSTAGLIINKGNVILSFFPEINISLKELSHRYESEIISAKGMFTAQTVMMDPETGQGAPYWPYTFNACMVLVEVDINTGRVELLKSVFAQDVGRAINPSQVRGQMDGGFAMSLGYTLYEDLALNKGEMINRKFSKYLLPTSMDMIDVENIIIEDPESTAPYGAKGIGEPVTLPIAPAILNAIYDATGVRFKNLPATSERLMKALSLCHPEPPLCHSELVEESWV